MTTNPYTRCPVCGETVERKVSDAQAPTPEERDRALFEEANQ